MTHHDTVFSHEAIERCNAQAACASPEAFHAAIDALREPEQSHPWDGGCVEGGEAT